MKTKKRKRAGRLSAVFRLLAGLLCLVCLAGCGQTADCIGSAASMQGANSPASAEPETEAGAEAENSGPLPTAETREAALPPVSQRIALNHGAPESSDEAAEGPGYYAVIDAPALEANEGSGDSVQVPILAYHHLIVSGTPKDADEITVARFREQLKALQQVGYTPVSFDQLLRYVNEGGTLPEKPIVLTFDDGYESNYTLAWPVLQEYNWPAAVFLIGVSMGKSTYKDTGAAITPHLTVAEAREMAESGLITFGSHGYDLHEVAGLDAEPVRKGALKRSDETEEQYAEVIAADCEKEAALIGQAPVIFSYPYGLWDDLSEQTLKANGFQCTLLTEEYVNTIIRGDPESLYHLGRYQISQDYTAEALLALLSDALS